MRQSEKQVYWMTGTLNMLESKTKMGATSLVPTHCHAMTSWLGMLLEFVFLKET